jgi:hypothetical protein
MSQREVNIDFQDRIFERAVELGCEPIRGNSVAYFWVCTCAGRIHAQSQYGEALISEMSLHRVQREKFRLTGGQQ